MPRASISSSASAPVLPEAMSTTGVDITAVTGAPGSTPASTTCVRRSVSVTMPRAGRPPTMTALTPSAVIRRATSRTGSSGSQVTNGIRSNESTVRRNGSAAAGS